MIYIPKSFIFIGRQTYYKYKILFLQRYYSHWNKLKIMEWSSNRAPNFLHYLLKCKQSPPYILLKIFILLMRTEFKAVILYREQQLVCYVYLICKITTLIQGYAMFIPQTTCSRNIPNKNIISMYHYISVTKI